MISDSEDKNVGLQYRLAHSCYILSNFCLSKEDNRNRLLEEGNLTKAYQYYINNTDIIIVLILIIIIIINYVNCDDNSGY
ncbi:unnamed protein product [Thelazia callipaeda]|uniref:Tetratricopeptide repeat protein n=1 Tax=Thelazia callipaeda TaxID=103827 RepID=A0A0N5D864_THECL|nr:unnamed protein product [Thelazia callipaeda]